MKPETYNSKFPHRLAVALVCATFPLIWVGGLVTTYDAGMAVPDWPNTYGYNLFLYPWETWVYGPWDLFIEHGHRLLAAAVGMLTIALAAAIWLREPRRWVRWLGGAAVLGVIGQGVLGGMRVLMDEVLLARIHACVGPLCFALAVALAVVTSRRWREVEPVAWSSSSSPLCRLAAITTALAYLQLVAGAHLRHVSPGMSPSAFRAVVVFHLVLAAVLLVQVLLLAIRVWRRNRADSWLVRPALGLALLMVLQLALGASSWVVKYSYPAVLGEHGWAAAFVVPEGTLAQATIVTAHVAVGSLILVAALTLAIRSARRCGRRIPSPTANTRATRQRGPTALPLLALRASVGVQSAKGFASHTKGFASNKLLAEAAL